MARVTVEDCILKVPNRFELVMLAAQRARDISAGAKETIKRDNDKGPVVALREIADGTLELKELEESLVRGLQKNIIFGEDEEDEEDAIQPELILTNEGEVEVEKTPTPAASVDALVGEDTDAQDTSSEAANEDK